MKRSCNSANKFGLLAPSSIAFDPHLHGVEQFLVAQRLGQKLDGPRFYCSNRHRNVAVTTDEYDWKLDTRLRQRPLKFQSARSRQPDVEHDAAGRVGALALKKFLY